jgi:hypothetical protein
MSTAYHPQTDKLTERMIGSMEQNLQVFVDQQHDNWVKRHPLAEFAANNEKSEFIICSQVFAIQRIVP